MGDHTARLVPEFEKRGIRTAVFTQTANASGSHVYTSSRAFGKAILMEIEAVIAKENIDTILWQYVPYSYHEKGLPFWWPGVMRRLDKPGLQQAVFFHEVSLRVWGYGIKQGIAAILQRLMANRAAMKARPVFTSIPLYAAYFWYKKPVIVPISANIGEEVNGERSAVGVVSEVQSYGYPPGGSYIFCFANRADKALVEGFAALRKEYSIQLVLGGFATAEQQQQVQGWLKESGIENAAVFTGALENAKLAAFIAGATFFIQPQIVERGNQGGISAKNGTVMAAMSLGKPIITCRGDMTDPALFAEGKNMVFVEYGNTAAYLDAMRSLLANPGMAEKIGLAAAGTYRQYCSWQVTAGQINEAISSS